MAARCQHDQSLALEQETGPNLMLEIVWNERSRVFRRRNLFREAAETINDTDLFLRIAKRLFEPTLRNLAGCERVIGHDRRLLCHHEQQICIKDRFPVECAVLAAIGIDACAKTVFAADEERQPGFE